MKCYFKLCWTLASVVPAWQWAGVYIIDCYLVFAAECWLIRNGVLSLIFFLPMREPSVPCPAQPASPATIHKLYSQVSNTKYVRQREGTRCRNLLDYSILPFCLSLRHYHEQAFKLVASTKMLMLVHKGQWSSNKYYAFITVSMSQLWNAERGNNWNTSLFSCCQVLVAGGGM